MSLHSYNTLFQVVTAGPTYTTLSEVKTIELAGIKVTQAAANSLTLVGAAKIFNQGLIDYGQINLELQYNHSQTTTLYSYLRGQQFFRISLTDGGFVGGTAGAGSNAFAASVETLGESWPDDDNIMLKVTLQVSGVLVIT